MKVMILASGSGGHVYPAIAFLRYLSGHGHQGIFIGIKGNFEERLGDLKDKSSIFLDIHNKSSYYLKHPFAYKKIIEELKKHDELNNYDAIVAFGGIMSFVSLFASRIFKKPLFLHEQNARLGDGNLFASLKAKKIFTVFDNTKMPRLIKKKVIQAGNPRSLEAKRFSHPLKVGAKKVLFFAGSLGSKTLIKSIKEMTNSLSSTYDICVITGTKYYEYFKKDISSKVEVIAYSDDLLKKMSTMDVVIMRAGATSISEIMALEINAILIPSPYVKHDHQRENALELKKKGIALVIEENEVNEDKIISSINILLNDKEEMINRKIRMRKLQNLYASNTMIETIKNEI